MKIDKPALKEAIVDTMLGAMINFPLSWLTIYLVLIFTTNSFIISLSQLIILSLLAIIRRYYIRVYFQERQIRKQKKYGQQQTQEN
jgi:hydrogenase-4 membrane subunit HyfE